jgi:hypothetical protein
MRVEGSAQGGVVGEVTAASNEDAEAHADRVAGKADGGRCWMRALIAVVITTAGGHFGVFWCVLSNPAEVCEVPEFLAFR